MHTRYCKKCGDTIVLADRQEALNTAEQFICFRCKARENKAATPRSKGAGSSEKHPLSFYSSSTMEVKRRQVEGAGARAARHGAGPLEGQSGTRGSDPAPKQLRFRCLTCHTKLEVRAAINRTSRMVCPKCKTTLFIDQVGLVSRTPPAAVVERPATKPPGVEVDTWASRGSPEASAGKQSESWQKNPAFSGTGLRKTAQPPQPADAKTVPLGPIRRVEAAGPAPVNTPPPLPRPAVLVALVAQPGTSGAALPSVLPVVAAPVTQGAPAPQVFMAAPAAQVPPPPPAAQVPPVPQAPQVLPAPPAGQVFPAPPAVQILAAPLPAQAFPAPPAAKTTPASEVAMVAPVALVAMAPPPAPAPGTAVPVLPVMVAPAVPEAWTAPAPLPAAPAPEALPGVAPPSPPVKRRSSSKRSLVRVPVYLPKRLLEKAQDTGRPISRLVRETLEEKLTGKVDRGAARTPESLPEPSERASKDEEPPAASAKAADAPAY